MHVCEHARELACCCQVASMRIYKTPCVCVHTCARLHGAYHRQVPGPFGSRKRHRQCALVAGRSHQRPPGQQGHAHGQGTGEQVHQAWRGIPDMALCPSRTPVVFPQVIQGCGNPKVNPQGSGPEEKRHQGKLVLQEKPSTGTLEKLVSGPQPARAWVDGGGEGRPSRAPCGLTAALQVSEAKTQLRDAQDFWISLPSMLCSERLAMSSASDDRCWNGMAKGRWVLPADHRPADLCGLTRVPHLACVTKCHVRRAMPNAGPTVGHGKPRQGSGPASRGTYHAQCLHTPQLWAPGGPQQATRGSQACQHLDRRRGDGRACQGSAPFQGVGGDSGPVLGPQVPPGGDGRWPGQSDQQPRGGGRHHQARHDRPPTDHAAEGHDQPASWRLQRQ